MYDHFLKEYWLHVLVVKMFPNFLDRFLFNLMLYLLGRLDASYKCRVVYVARIDSLFLESDKTCKD